MGSSSLSWEALGYMEEAEDLGDTFHSQSCREVVALYVKDSKKYYVKINARYIGAAV